jgi:hypothetical protein
MTAKEKNFSQRSGLKEAEPPFRLNGISDELRLRLWNIFVLRFENNCPRFRDREPRISLVAYVWTEFFKGDVQAYDGKTRDDFISDVKRWFFRSEWNEILDFCEFIIHIDRYKQTGKLLYDAFELENSGYRVIEGQIVPITEENEIESIKKVLTLNAPFGGSRSHLVSAVKFLKSQDEAAKRKAIQEAILGVEAAVRELVGDSKATLGDGLKKIDILHSALAGGLSKIYGYTSDADGIRHAMAEDSKLTAADAKYFVVLCSAFINLLVEKAPPPK